MQKNHPPDRYNRDKNLPDCPVDAHTKQTPLHKVNHNVNKKRQRYKRKGGHRADVLHRQKSEDDDGEVKDREAVEAHSLWPCVQAGSVQKGRCYLHERCYVNPFWEETCF